MSSNDNQKISVVEGMKKSGMPYVRLGNSGLQVSRICLGMMTYGSTKWREWVLEEQEARPFVKRALEFGINFFDTADSYSTGVSEEITGRALNDMAIREEIVVATKVFHEVFHGPNRKGLSRKHIFEACDASLKRLNMDYIDLYQIHRFDKETPIEETMEALNDLVRSGKLVYREEEREMNPLCIDQGVGLIPWSPLARGFLIGNRTQTDAFGHQLYYADSDFEIVERLKTLAEKKQVKPAQLALAWILSKPGVCAPIIGASKMYQLEEAVAATSIKLSDEDIKSLEELYQPHRVVGHW
ncbi:unnamed protein product [Rotaria sp. Silwood2]|nr:unnamed protein product [Rotaria sp. Silwood2]CAF4439562.1 unnamed protein product [Rotaria sp. Silwood2]